MQSTYTREGLWGLGALIAFSLILCVYLITSSLQTIILNKGRITVKGYAEKKITSDYTTWSGNVSVRAETLPEAYEKLEKDFNAIVAYLDELGIKKEDLKVASVQISSYYKLNDKGTFTNEIEGYTLRQDFYLSSHNIEQVSTVADQLTNLIKEGIEVVSYAPSYFYTKIDELKIQMLGEAAKDALVRAHQLAVNSGSSVGKLRNAQQGVFQITPAFSTSVSDYGENDVSAIDKSIKAVITMEYAID